MQSAAWPVPDARSRSDQGDVTTSGAAHGRRRLHRGVPCSMLSSHQDHQPSCGLLLSCVHLQGTSLFSSVCRADCHWCSSCYQEVVAASGLCAPFQLERDNQVNGVVGDPHFQRYPLPQPPPASGSAVKKGFHCGD
nr:uncharacterized protein LOC127314552 isoform X4 [Lolium perenne]